MAEGLNGFTRKVSVKWIKAESGATYLCPVAVLDLIDGLSEDELRLICVEVPVDPHDN